MAAPAAVNSPVLVPTDAIVPLSSGATVNAPNVLPWHQDFSDRTIRGAAVINPVHAAEFIAGNYPLEFPLPTYSNAPLEVKDKKVASDQATIQEKNAWKKQTWPAWAIRFAPGAKEQKPAPVPWVKKFIPPLALFNDASQWVNILMFNQPMQPWDGGDSDPPLMAQYFTPPPINTPNFAAGTANVQLQLGMMRNQVTQLTINAQNYFGGS